MPLFVIPLDPKPLGQKQLGTYNYILGPCKTMGEIRELVLKLYEQEPEPRPFLVVIGTLFSTNPGQPELEAIDEMAAGFWDEPDRPDR